MSLDHLENIMSLKQDRAAGTSLSLKEAGRRLGLSKNTVYKLANQGELPGVYRIGPSWRVDAARLEEWLRERT